MQGSNKKADHVARIELAIRATLEFKLSSTESILLHIIAHKDGDGRGCFLSSTNLAKAAGIRHRATLYKALSKLESLELITSQSVGSKRPTIRRFKAGLIQSNGETQDSNIVQNRTIDGAKSHQDNMVQNRTIDGAKSHQDMVQNCTTNKTLTGHEPTTPVGVVGSCLKPGERVLTFDGTLRLVARPIEDVEKKSALLIAAPTRETSISMKDNARSKAWDAWLKAEKPPKETTKEWQALWAFAIFVWHRMKRKPDRATLSRAWNQHEWVMRDEDRLTIVNGKIVPRR